jgi:hypothetical protein
MPGIEFINDPNAKPDHHDQEEENIPLMQVKNKDAIQDGIEHEVSTNGHELRVLLFFS